MSGLVSLLVPIYGVEQYIERCARSLFEQTYSNLEYVFVNDCTPDKSIEVLQKVMDDYPERKGTVRIVDHEKNRGLAAARNTAIDHATGEFVCLVDSDDWMELNALEWLVMKQREKDADIVSGNRMVHYPDKEFLLQEEKYQSREEMTLRMMQRSWDHFITGRLIKRTLFIDHSLRWKEGLDVAEDRYMMTLLAYHAERSDTVETVVYHYERRNTNAMTISDNSRNIFRNNEQELENVLALRDFFYGKDKRYMKECSRALMNQLNYNLTMALAYSSKKELEKTVDVVDNCSDEELGFIGWKKTGFKGRCLHNYHLMRLDWLGKKTVRYLKKRLSCKKP